MSLCLSQLMLLTAWPRHLHPCTCDMRSPFYQAIRKLGGHQNAARVMRFRTARRQRHRWRDFDTVVRELSAFIQSQPEQCRHRMPTQRQVLEVRCNACSLLECFRGPCIVELGRVSLSTLIVLLYRRAEMTCDTHFSCTVT